MVPTRGSNRKNERDERKKDMPKTPGSGSGSGPGSNPGSQHHEEKAPGRNPAPTRPANEPRKDMPEKDEDSEGEIERGRQRRDDR